MRWYLWVGLAAIGGAAWTVYGMSSRSLLPQGAQAQSDLRTTVAAQDELSFYRPANTVSDSDTDVGTANLYFGDLHIHTSLSFDSYLFGNRLDADSAYRFAKGERQQIGTGERIELARPLDFAAITDHAEGFGRQLACDQPDLSDAGRKACQTFEQPSIRTFMALRKAGEARPPIKDLAIFGGDPGIARDYAATTWQIIKDAAERHNQPGQFTTFAGYEYSPVLADRGKHHRNVIFRSATTPVHAISAYDAASEIDLWKQLAATCTAECDFLTIPHNPNKTWGLAFASETIDGVPYTDADWRLRQRFEPIVEMFQIKGNSECSAASGATDEECGFEQYLPPCKAGQTTGCIFPTSMVRDGLKKGLTLQGDLGFNPLAFGLVGSTDTHNANPGDAEEWDFRGASGYVSSPAEKRLSSGRGSQLGNNPGGLAAIWAKENTRDALFDAMARKEVYATSGTRIRLRVFAGFELPEDPGQNDIATLYKRGVPMGGTLEGRVGALSLFAWALQDPQSAPLAKIQIIKGWMADGQAREAVYDVACGNGPIDPVTGRCTAESAQIDVTSCRWNADAGSKELKAHWQDPAYDPDVDAFYYVRVVQNPTCRWTTYDSLRLGRVPPAGYPATITEMAWASPIWLQRQGR